MLVRSSKRDNTTLEKKNSAAGNWLHDHWLYNSENAIISREIIGHNGLVENYTRDTLIEANINYVLFVFCSMYFVC